MTVGYTPRDLHRLIRRVLLNPIPPPRPLTLSSLHLHLQSTPPTQSLEFTLTKPDARLADVPGYDALKIKLRQTVEWTLLTPDVYERLGVKPPTGLLLFGPSGCGKTWLVEALGGSLDVNFITAK